MPVDWQDEIFRKGLVQSYQLSATGGNEGAKYFISGDYLNQDAYLKTSIMSAILYVRMWR